MCGIVGYFATNRKYAAQAKGTMAKLLINSQARGSDACGVAFLDDHRNLQVVKAPVAASVFVKSPDYLAAIQNHTPRIMIGHTRLKTQGDAKNNQNNHPVFSKNGLAVVHNGVISNDDELFKKYALPRDSEVDTEIILRLTEYYREHNHLPIVKALQNMAGDVFGSMTCAVLDRKNPNSLYLLRSSNPLALAYEVATGIFYFASDRDFIESSLAVYKFHMGFFGEDLNRGKVIYHETTAATESGFIIKPRSVTPFAIVRPTYATAVGYQYGGYGYADNDDYGDRFRDENGGYYLQKDLATGQFVKHYYTMAGARENPAASWKRTWTEKKKPFVKDYEPDRQAIKKPSLYATPQLEDRLEVLNEQLDNGVANNNDMNEIKRIESALMDRMAKEYEAEKATAEAEADRVKLLGSGEGVKQ